MSFTGTGLVLISLGLICFILSRKWLYILMIFFIPFSATAIVNISSGFWLTPFQLFGMLWIAKEVLAIQIKKKRSLVSFSGWSIWLLFIFYGFVVLSIIMPFIIDGQLLIYSPMLFDLSADPLYFTSRNLTTTFYVLFGVIIATLIAINNSRADVISLTLKAYLLSGVFVSLWGLLQLLAFKFNFYYPEEIFNNSLNPVAQGFLQKIEETESLNTTRIASVAVEPSIFAQFLLTNIPIVLFAILSKKTIISKAFDITSVIIMVLALLLSTSSSAYIGICFMIFMTLLFAYVSGILRLSHLLLIFSAAVLCVILYFTISPLNEFINLFLFSKSDTGSGLERVRTISLAWSYFVEYPFLGVGWGSVTSHDLIVNLLSNSGILGFSTFAAMVGYILGRTVLLVNRYKRKTKKYNLNVSLPSAFGLIISMSTLLFLQIVTGFTYYFGHFWFLLGMLIAVYSVICIQVAAVESKWNKQIAHN